jgi:adenine-specific DNA methylase
MAVRSTPAKKTGKAARIAEEIARAVGAGRPVAVETVDFGDPNRPKTCLEVDFPILPINQIAAIEGNAGKPIYQMSKWWARRRSSVFRSMLLAAAMKAPDDPMQAAKAVWDVYYANHQKKGALKHLKVADIFMGGGTTIVEGSRLGMQMWGTDLNPVAWFVVKNELAKVDPAEVKALLDDIEAEVKPQIMPFYACDCPRGHKGKWTHLPSGRVMDHGFDPFSSTAEQRKDYQYEGPEIIYVFWAKHGPCQVTGCGHRTPLFSNPVIAVKTLTVRAWLDRRCDGCGKTFDTEEHDARMAPGVPLVVSEGERPFAVLNRDGSVACPHCGRQLRHGVSRADAKNKKVDLSLLIHPDWLAGSPKMGPDGREFGGSATDTPEATAAWNRERARHMKLVEVRGSIPDEVTCPDSRSSFRSDTATLGSQGVFTCGKCGTAQRFVAALEKTGKTAPVAACAIQGYCSECDALGLPYGGRFFCGVTDTAAIDAAVRDWAARCDADLAEFWPRSEIPFGHMTHQRQPLPQHGYSHWWKMFNPRQLLVHAQILRAVANVGGDRYGWDVRDFVLGAFQQYLRNQNMFSFWHMTYDKLAPSLSNANFHPKSNVIEVGVFSPMGYGPWSSSIEPLFKGKAWATDPWELVSIERLKDGFPAVAAGLAGRSEKVLCEDPLNGGATVACSSATDLANLPRESYDLVITDPPFGGLMHYAELADFFYVWLRLVLRDRYPEYFSAEYTPKTLEAVSNRARQPEDPDGFYQRLLTQCWQEANGILKPGGLLAFTFHHSEDEPWVAVLESLFDAGFYLEATYPIRSDETKGEGEFGSKKIEYDIIHVCRKRTDDPKPVSWGRMRREVLQEVRQMRSLLEHHAKDGLPLADLQVIKRGKALEYFSRHYGKVYVDEDRVLSVRDAVAGIIQLLDEESGKIEPPPVTAEPFTRQFLRVFDGKGEQPRDQMQKFLRGTGIAPDEFEQRGWCREEKKIYKIIAPLEIARAWYGKHRRNLTSDYDQAMFLIGGCFEGSGINVSETLKNEHFKPRPALGALLEWHARRAPTQDARNAAARALAIYRDWERSHQEQAKQMSLFYGDAAV